MTVTGLAVLCYINVRLSYIVVLSYIVQLSYIVVLHRSVVLHCCVMLHRSLSYIVVLYMV